MSLVYDGKGIDPSAAHRGATNGSTPTFSRATLPNSGDWMINRITDTGFILKSGSTNYGNKFTYVAIE